MGNAFLADCPTRLTTEIISDKWSAVVLFALRQEPKRHGELVETIGGISRKVLTQTLRRLQEYGLVEHHVPEYSLTELGQSLIEPIEILNTWAVVHGEAVVDHQESTTN